MKVQTERFGELEIADSRVITFNKGIPGFEDYKEYVLIPADEKGETPFFFLQSIEEEKVNFFLLDTFSFFKDYDLKIEDKTVVQLQIEEPTDVIVFTTITVKGEIKNATTNLKAPLVINTTKQLGMQIVLDNKNYLIKQPIFQNSDKDPVRQV